MCSSQRCLPAWSACPWKQLRNMPEMDSASIPRLVRLVLELTEWCALRCANANPQEASSPSRRSCSVPIPCWTTVWIHGHHPAEALLQELQVRDLIWCIVNRG